MKFTVEGLELKPNKEVRISMSGANGSSVFLYVPIADLPQHKIGDVWDLERVPETPSTEMLNSMFGGRE